ncbi:putative ankyrin repeat-containing domain, protein accelerated cell death 6 [Medicago truncatula]|uniref:Putative ankyrin repeat-containing domain, protein accelerated cell death 6 n=1 Tax=Medicago truncatula TaxID=3880 RepID=A0A396HVF0_MEDTR|nr:putative ankyrin repeat-containing domain, protein accelerated cell death 6 [Medicago truncatula]
MPPCPEGKLFFAEPLQDEALSRNVSSDKEPELEIQPSEVIEILPECCKFDNQIDLLSKAYLLVYGVSTNLLDFSKLTKIETPMENTVLHIAVWYGNNDIVNLVIEHAPKLLFKFNENNDSALHVAARYGHISTVEKLLASYANIERSEIKMAWLEYNDSQVSEQSARRVAHHIDSQVSDSNSPKTKPDEDN